jgi:oligogalacturonide transporter
MSAAVKPSRPVRWYTLAAYGSNDVLGAGSMAVVSTWILIFYTTFCGLSAAQATLIFGIARVLDAIASPLIGHFSDHLGATRLGKRFGRRRPLILAAIPLLPAFALMWVPGQGFLYYLITYVMFELVYALIIIPYETLAAEMASDYATKAKFAGARILCGQLSAVAAAFLPGWLIHRLGKDSPQTYLYMGVIFAGLFMFTVTMLWLFSWERERADVAEQESTPKESLGSAITALYRNLLSTLRIRAFRLHLGMYVGGYVGQDIYNAAFTFFVIFALAGTTATVASLVGVTYAIQLVAVGLAINFALRISPGYAYRFAALSFALGVAGFIGLYAAGITASSALLWIPVVLAGLGRGAINYIPWATYNYMADVDEIVTGKRREGAFAGVMTFVRKLSQAAAVILVGQVMQGAGFAAKVMTQSPQAIHAIVAVLGLGTLTLLAFGTMVSRRFQLDARTHAVLMAEIDHLRANPDAEPTSPANRAIVESLSGWRYEQLWGRNDIR